MILTCDNEYRVVLDACVLVPMPLCDTLLRFAEDPALFCIVWSEQILDEVRRSLDGPSFGYTEDQINRRINTMRKAFPEACVTVPQNLIPAIIGLPDPDDRHVVAAAIHSHSNAIITNNLKDFPEQVLSPHAILIQSADDFLIHQFHLNQSLTLEKLDTQAVAIRKTRSDLLVLLAKCAPKFCNLMRE